MLDGWIVVCAYDRTHSEPALVDFELTLDNALVQHMNRLWHTEKPPRALIIGAQFTRIAE